MAIMRLGSVAGGCARLAVALGGAAAGLAGIDLRALKL
jgi:hypothetical protein